MSQPLEQLLRDLPLLVPAILVTAFAATVLARRVAAGLGTGRATAFVLIAGLGLVLAVTLSPADPNLRRVVGCDLGTLGLLSPGQLLAVSDRSLNVWLFVPLGVGLGVLPRSRAKAGLIGAALLLPLGIEAIQYVVTGLGRECEGRDVIDNLVGLGIGLLVPAIGGLAPRPRPPVA